MLHVVGDYVLHFYRACADMCVYIYINISVYAMYIYIYV